MKMSVKLILLFSVLAIAITLTFSVFSYQTSLENLYSNVHSSLDAMAEMMATEFEQYMDLMDYATEELTSSSEFMDAYYALWLNKDNYHSNNLAWARAQVSRVMFQAPLLSLFHEVNIFDRDGFFLTNRVAKQEDIISFSDEAKEVAASLEFLDQLDADPDRHLVQGPHPNYWYRIDQYPVFSIFMVLNYHDTSIGYLEVSAAVDDLADIFFIQEESGLSSQAIFDDGTALFRTFTDEYDYGNIPPGEMITYSISNASDRLVVRKYSEKLGLSIYVSQEIDALGATRAALFQRYLLVMLPILLCTILLIVLFSLGLTSSIRKLRRKMTDLPAERFLSQTDITGPTHVVKPRDMEMYELEETFNNLLTKLRISHDNEVSLREGTLKAQLNALQLQINPHFVYNTLNIISSKGLESGSEEITEICDQFARMLRYSTDVRSQTATLREELDNVHNYLFLCKMRYEDQLEYEINVPSDMMDEILPRLTLQPLVENALKHGTKHGGDLRRIIITGLWENGRLSLTIRDNGEGFDWDTLRRLRMNFRLIEKNEQPEYPQTEGHVGLLNTYRRVHYFSQGRLRLELYNDNGAVVKLIETSSGDEEDTTDPNPAADTSSATADGEEAAIDPEQSNNKGDL